jgi:DNA polymerase-3 subunit epsilon
LADKLFNKKTLEMMDNFTAIDFETAQGKRWSICQVGIVRVEEGRIVEELSILVQPPQNFYWSNFTDIHGISSEHTVDSPSFDQIWPQIAPFITNQNVVAHNGFAFDFPCLQQTLEYYQLQNPNFIGHCTYKLYRDNLASLCRQYNIPLNHHDALSDARACAELFLKHLKQ